MNRQNHFLLVCFVTLITISCANKEAREQYEKANLLLKAYEYNKAISICENIVNKYPKTMWADSAREVLLYSKTAVNFIDSTIVISRKCVEAREYDAAIILLQALVKDLGVNDSLNSIIKSWLLNIQLQRNNDLEYIINIVVNRMAQGISPEFALGEYTGLHFKCDLRIDYVCTGIEGWPVRFRKGKWGINGFAAEGLHKMNYVLLCERNQGRMAEVEGILYGGNDWPGVPLAVLVNYVKVK